MSAADTLLSPKLVVRAYPFHHSRKELVPPPRYHEHWCPGCRLMHQIAVDQPFRNGARWTFDGNAEAPTFSPSVHIRLGYGDPGRPERVCHYFVRGGRIEFCGDSTHDLAGQTVDLPDIPADEVDDVA